MTALLAACGGFLLGVLWMDLLFDVQILGADPSAGVASIVAYYRRATIEAYPMNRLIALIMLVTLGVTIYGLVRRRLTPRRRLRLPSWIAGHVWTTSTAGRFRWSSSPRAGIPSAARRCGSGS